LRPAVLLLVALTLLSCSGPTQQSGEIPTPSESPASDFRVRLDLLLSEHVMIVAKESQAAIDHTDDYQPYATLLATNSSDLETLLARAFGRTTAHGLRQLWDGSNFALVDYAIGVVTHDDGKAKAAITSLTNDFAPRFAVVVAGATHLQAGAIEQDMKQQAVADKAFIDDAFSRSYDLFYADLHTAYVLATKFADPLAEQITGLYPDKFPGNLALRSAMVRSTANVLLQERSYLTTMSTAAVVGGRPAEASSASAALRRNTHALANMVAATLGMEPNTLNAELDDEARLVVAYANGSNDVRATFIQNARDFASTAHVPSTYAPTITTRC